jgi:hypothetical protein
MIRLTQTRMRTRIKRKNYGTLRTLCKTLCPLLFKKFNHKEHQEVVKEHEES